MISNDDNEEETNDKVNIFTVCNETYTTDNYLIPTPSNQPKAEPDHSLPLLETRATDLGDLSNGHSDPYADREMTTFKPKLDVNDVRNNNKVKSEEQNEGNSKFIEQGKVVIPENKNRSQDRSRVVTSHRGQEPMFRKKSENTLPTIRYTKNNKNKHVIYPSENVALLTENGSARCVRDTDSNEHETSQF